METVKFTGLLFFWMAVAATNESTYVPCDDCTDRATPSELANISLRVYPNSTIDQFESVLVGDVLDLCSSISANKPTVLYSSGWKRNPDSDRVQVVVDAYLKRQDHNIMVVDWQEIAAQNYAYAALSVIGVGYTVATAINNLVAAGCLDPSTLHVVGHSLGAQTSGAVGRSVNFTLPRITGLDPAGPGYHELIPALTSADAAFVDVINTDAGVQGTSLNRGTVNFHPNGGVGPQPGCLLSGTLATVCSHARAWQYYAESLMNENAFMGVECDSYHAFKTGSCSSNTRLVMGYATPTDASGNFYLQTNKASPYGRETRGETFIGTDALKDLLP